MKTILATRLLSLLAAAALALGSTTSVASEVILLEDDFEDLEVETPTSSAGQNTWEVVSGSFKADGTDTFHANYKPTGGQLNFGIEAKTTIRIPLAIPDDFTSQTISFDLRHSDDAAPEPYYFFLRLYDTSQSAIANYEIQMCLKTIYGGGPDDLRSGFQLHNGQTGAITKGADGLALENGPFKNLSLTFDPATAAITLEYGGVTVLTGELPGFNRIDKIQFVGNARDPALQGQDRGVSWFVDNVKVSATSESGAGAR